MTETHPSRETATNPVLLLSRGASLLRRIALDRPRFVIGRAQGADIPLDDPQISRQHAELVQDPFGRWWVNDLDSHNGTRINGQSVKSRVLGPGDSVELGAHRLSLQLPASELTIIASPAATATLSDEPITHLTSLGDAQVPKLSRQHLREVLKMGEQLSHIEQPEQRLATLCSSLVGGIFRGRCCMALRVPISGDPLMLCPPASEPSWESLAFKAPRKLIAATLAAGQPLLAANVSTALADVNLSLSEATAPMAAVACPLSHAPNHADLLILFIPPQCGNSEWLVLVSLAVEQFAQAEAAWAARHEAARHATIERELERARTIQRLFLPAEPHVDGLDLCIDFQPSTWVGGDYVDVIPLSDGRVLLTVADVAGKGLQAALVSSSVHAILHTLCDVATPLPKLASALNRHLCQHLHGRSFVTMAFVILDPLTGQLECLNAGHPPPLVLDHTGVAGRLQSCANLPLGIQESDFEIAADVIRPGSWLAMYTDGLTDISDSGGKMLGLAGLEHLMAQAIQPRHDLPAANVAAAMSALLRQNSGPSMALDDQTLLLSRRM